MTILITLIHVENGFKHLPTYSRMVDAWEEFEDHLRFYQITILVSGIMSVLIIYVCS